MSRPDVSRIAATLEGALSEQEINELGKAAGQSQRLRQVTPFRLLVTLLGALGEGTTETIADLCREFNYAFGTTTAYKAFYNRLARPGFAEFTRQVVSQLLTEFAVRILEPSSDSPLARFSDIVIQDGSSFALKASLCRVFPGRFKTIDPAAVEVHATLSGFEDEVMEVSLAPDTTQERAFLPEAAGLTNKLLLADRGYPSREYFMELEQAGASFILRLSRSFKPYVRAVHGPDGAIQLRDPQPLPKFLEGHASSTALDLDVELRKGKCRYSCRVAILPGKEQSGTRLCTNLPRDDFPLERVARLYRFRWQIELLFKEWKSYANLRSFDTGNEHIAEGLIWASLAAAILKRFIAHATQRARGRAISTRKVAMAARVFLRDLLAALGQPRTLRTVLARVVDFLDHNARRADLERDRRRGRLGGGLLLCGVPK